MALILPPLCFLYINIGFVLRWASCQFHVVCLLLPSVEYAECGTCLKMDLKPSHSLSIPGIVSWGPSEGCRTEGKFGVYTNVASYVDWIKDTIRKYG